MRRRFGGGGGGGGGRLVIQNVMEESGDICNTANTFELSDFVNYWVKVLFSQTVKIASIEYFWFPLSVPLSIFRSEKDE